MDDQQLFVNDATVLATSLAPATAKKNTSGLEYLITQSVMGCTFPLIAVGSFAKAVTAHAYPWPKWFLPLTNWQLSLACVLAFHAMSVAYLYGRDSGNDSDNRLEKYRNSKCVARPLNILSVTILSVIELFWGGVAIGFPMSTGFIAALVTHGGLLPVLIMNLRENPPLDNITSWKGARAIIISNLILPVSYLGFALAYTYSNGTNKDGDHFIYPFLDFLKKPGLAWGVSLAGISAFAINGLLIAWAHKMVQSMSIRTRVTECWQSICHRGSELLSNLSGSVASLFNRRTNNDFLLESSPSRELASLSQ